MWWHAPVIPATQEAEAGESLEPRGRSCSEPRSCHCTPAWVTEQDSVSKIIIIIIIIIIIVRYAIIFSHLQHVLNQASHITSAQWPQHTDLKMSPISLFPKIVLNLTFYLIFGCSKRISNNLTKWWKVIPFNEGMVGQNKEVKERFELALFIEKSSHVSVYSFKTNFYF